MKRIIWATGLLGCWAAGLSGQQIPQQLSLEEAQRLASLHNPAFRRAQNDIYVADANVKQSYGRFMPRLSTSLGFSGNASSTLTATDDFGRPIADTRRIETESSSASQGVGLNLNLFDGGANLKNLSAAKAQHIATEASIDQEANRLRAQVSKEYFAALRAEQAIKLEETLLASRKDALERTQKLLSVASSKYVDVLSARVDVASAEQAVDNARGSAEKSKLQLKQTMGLEGPATFALTSEPPAIFDPARLDVEALVRLASVGAPSVRLAEARLRAADKQSSAARAGRLPQINTRLNYGRSTQARGYDAFGEFNPPNRSLNFGLDISLPLFSQFQTSYQIANADAAEIDARETLRQEKLAVESEVRAAVIDLNNAYRTARLAEQKAELSGERLAAAQEEYRIGSVSFFQLQQYADQAAQADRQMLDARFQFANAVVALEERIGKPLER